MNSPYINHKKNEKNTIISHTKFWILAILSFGLNTGILADVIDSNKKACDSDDARSCFNLGAMYAKGESIKQDDFKAVKYFQKACDLDEGVGCSNLGIMYEKGKGIRQSNTKALKYYGKSCDLKVQFGCKYYAELKNK